MSSDESGSNPFERVDEPPATPDGESLLGSAYDRRRFLKAAALGTAAAAMYEGGSLFRPLVAYADDLSALNCTANDVRIPAPGQILNEPCTCSGTFDAQVSFPVVNNTGTNRYCVTLHLCAGTDANGNVVVPAQDVVIGNIPPNFNGTKTVTIPNYPCGAGVVCFGARGSEADGGFPKGADCPTGQCCTTINWNVKASDPCPDTGRPITSKCRHQQICIVGRGITTLDCDPADFGIQTNCPVECGAMHTVRLCTTNPPELGPFTFTLDGQSFGPTTDTCHDFEVGPITADTTVTGTVTDKDGCAKSASVVLTTAPIPDAQIAVAGNENCDGNLTFTASVPGRTGCSFAWTIDGNAAGTGDTLSYPADPDGECHTIGVTADCGGCPASGSTTVRQCVSTATGCTP